MGTLLYFILLRRPLVSGTTAKEMLIRLKSLDVHMLLIGLDVEHMIFSHLLKRMLKQPALERASIESVIIDIK